MVKKPKEPKDPKKSAKAESKPMVLKAPEFRTIRFRIVGISGLMTKRFSEKAAQGVKESEEGVPKTRKRPPRNPQEEFHDAMHIIGSRTVKGVEVPIYGHVAQAFHKAMVAAARNVDGLTMTELRQQFLIPSPYVEIERGPDVDDALADWPHMDARPARNPKTKGAMMVYRPLFWPWACNLDVEYMVGTISEEQIAHLLLIAGRTVGVGELRPEKGGGAYGRFTIG